MSIRFHKPSLANDCTTPSRRWRFGSRTGERETYLIGWLRHISHPARRAAGRDHSTIICPFPFRLAHLLRVFGIPGGFTGVIGFLPPSPTWLFMVNSLLADSCAEVIEE